MFTLFVRVHHAKLPTLSGKHYLVEIYKNPLFIVLFHFLCGRPARMVLGSSSLGVQCKSMLS